MHNKFKMGGINMKGNEFQQPPIPNQQQPLQSQYQYEYHPQYQMQDEQTLKHSGMGIASFIMSLLLGPGLFLLVIIAGVLQASTPGGIDNTSPAAVFLGLIMLFTAGLTLIGIGLGIAGVVQKKRKKIFAVLGLIFNSVVVLAFLLLMIVGLISKK